MNEDPHFSVEISVDIDAVHIILTDTVDSVNIDSGENFLKQNRARTGISQPYHHGDLRQALIAAARELLTKNENDGFSLREVAAHAGVSHNAPYNHFADKQDLLIAVAAAGFERLRDHMRTAVRGIAAADEALLASGKAYIELALEN